MNNLKKDSKAKEITYKDKLRKYKAQCPQCTHCISTDHLSALVSSIKEHMSRQHNTIIEDPRKRREPYVNLLQESPTAEGNNKKILGWSLECPPQTIELKPCSIENCEHVIRAKKGMIGLYRTEKEAFLALGSHVADNHSGGPSIKSKHFYENLNLYINYIENSSSGQKRKAENQDIEGDKEILNSSKRQKSEDLKNDSNSLYHHLPPLDIEVGLNYYNWDELNND